MSWQAIAWAIRQTTGAARRKLLLLALANYADKDGVLLAITRDVGARH